MWTNDTLQVKGKKACSIKEFYACLGLKMGMPLVNFNDIKRFWAEGNFVGHETFCRSMPRTTFQDIHEAICLISPKSYDNDTANDDPLWSCMSLLDQFIWWSADIAVPFGMSTLDENSCATKACTRAKTYIPSKPDKYAI